MTRSIQLNGRVLNVDTGYEFETIQEAIDNPTIIHFVGAYKPWIHPGKYFLHKEKYWKYFNLSPWANKDSNLVWKRLQETKKGLNN